MNTTQEYLNMAKQYGEGNAHVAVYLSYVQALDAAEPGQAVEIVKEAVDYANKLKKQPDQQAVFEWALRVPGIKGTQFCGELEKKIAEIQTEGGK